MHFNHCNCNSFFIQKNFFAVKILTAVCSDFNEEKIIIFMTNNKKNKIFNNPKI